MDIANLKIDCSKDNGVLCKIYFNEEVKNNPKPVFMKPVSKEKFEEFIKNYPNKLEKDYYMDWFSWNDFSLNGGCEWPESMVAMMSDGSYDQSVVYKILLDACGDEDLI